MTAIPATTTCRTTAASRQATSTPVTTPATNLKWINAYWALRWDAGMDPDGSPEAVLATSFDMVQRQTAEELQLHGTAFDKRLNYAVGAYYFHESGHLHDYVTFPLGLRQVDGPNDLQTRAKALYAHCNFKLTDQWAITLGARKNSRLFTAIRPMTPASPTR